MFDVKFKNGCHLHMENYQPQGQNYSNSSIIKFLSTSFVGGCWPSMASSKTAD